MFCDYCVSLQMGVKRGYQSKIFDFAKNAKIDLLYNPKKQKRSDVGYTHTQIP